jgi:hypothetical protein
MQRLSWRLVIFVNLNASVANVRQNSAEGASPMRVLARGMKVPHDVSGFARNCKTIHQRPIRFARTNDFIKWNGAARQD